MPAKAGGLEFNMKKKNRFTGIITLTVVAILSIIIIFGSRFLAKYNGKGSSTNQTAGTTESLIDISSYDNTGDVFIKSASSILANDGSIDGYIVTVATKGLNGDIIMDVNFDKTGDNVTKLAIIEQSESEGYGAKITEDGFLNQFNGIAAPVYLLGMAVSDKSTVEDATVETAAVEAPSVEDSTSTVVASSTWVDGIFVAESEGFDNRGFIDTVSITVQNGKITEVLWDAYNDAGEYKSVLSADGAYEMSEGGAGLSWQEQAVALAEYVIEKQSIDAVTINGDNKTDSVAGVSISINEFIRLAENCLVQASSTSSVDATTSEASPAEPSPTELSTEESTPVEQPTSSVGTPIDGISGATISSKAVVDGINVALTFVKTFVIGK